MCDPPGNLKINSCLPPLKLPPEYFFPGGKVIFSPGKEIIPVHTYKDPWLTTLFHALEILSNVRLNVQKNHCAGQWLILPWRQHYPSRPGENSAGCELKNFAANKFFRAPRILKGPWRPFKPVKGKTLKITLYTTDTCSKILTSGFQTRKFGL